MIIKNIMDSNFQDYRECSMLLCTASCSFKCEGCQNKQLINEASIDIPNEQIVDRYIKNPITSAIIFGGLEPFEQYSEMIELIKCFRKKTQDMIIIYTGFSEKETSEKILELQKYPKIIVKFGRFLLNSSKTYDKILGIELASENQYAKQIS